MTEQNSNPNNLLRVSGVEYDAPVGKLFKLGKDGKLIKDRGNRSERGRAICRDLTFEDYASWRQTLGGDTILVVGNFESTVLHGRAVAYKDCADGITSISLSNKFLAHRPGPAILRIDIDTKRKGEVAGLCPERPQKFLTPEQAEKAFLKVIPEAKGCALLVTDSSSSRIKHGNKMIKGAGGYRIEIPVTDGTRIPDIIDHIHEACWAKGYGWAFVDGGGGILYRSLADEALKKPAQPDYAAPECVDDLCQDRRWLVREGKHLDPAIIKPLSADEKAAASAAKAEANFALEKIAATVRSALRKREKEKAKERGVTITDKAIDDLLDRRVLRSDMEVVFDDGEVLTVFDLLIKGEAYDGRVCFDPIEPGYDGGRTVGKFYWNKGRRPGVNSFAHGQRWFSITPDFKCVMEMLATATLDFEEEVSRVWSFSDMSEIDAAKAEKEAAERLGIGNQRKPIREAVKAWKDTPDEIASEEELSPQQQAFADQHFVLTQGDKVRVCKFRHDRKLVRLSERDFVLQEKNNFIRFGDRQLCIAVWWLSWRGRKTFVNGTGLYPDGIVPAGTLNLWRGWCLEPVEGEWRTIRTHLLEVVCSGDKEYYDYLIHWLARTVQHPERQGEVCVVMKGRQGCGKSVLSKLMRRVFGDHARQVSQREHLIGKFNSHLEDCCFLFADEAIFSGDPTIKGPLKSLITESRVTIEPKGVNAFEVPNRLSIMMATNEEWAVPVETGDRRYFVLDVSSNRIGDNEYFTSLHRAIESDEAGHFLHHLLNMDLSDFDLRGFPKTEAHSDIMVRGLKGVQAFLFDLLYGGHAEGLADNEKFLGKKLYNKPGQVTDEIRKKLWMNKTREIAKNDLHRSFVSFCEHRKDTYTNTHPQVFWSELRKYLLKEKKGAFMEHRIGKASNRSRVLRFHSLGEVRAIFEQNTGLGPKIWD
ncbi:MAG: hypothetical protein HOG95_01390 [Rhodospirillaceae bacterium]|jgi:hypothetical protein|nr:hypothetical protein [Rhodospirillaceae bacterium]MBT5938548.1 hypothetical protein [Rhodospirillaceae bacterium]MBT7268171.1 hypothetical protein [Rhodospirillaceae bacterium]